MRLCSWNVNGLRSAHGKGFLHWLADARPDVVGLQEVRARPEQLPEEVRSPDGYHAWWAPAERAGYSGVGLLSRTEPRSVEIGLGIDEYDREGRTIAADFGQFVFITAYFPNGGRDLERVPFKMAYKAAFLEHCEALRAQGRTVVFGGDINTAHREIDLARPKANKGSTGFLPEERAWIDEVVSRGWLDTFRHLHPDAEGAYSWWTYVGGARERNVGWRLDQLFASPDLADRVAAAEIHADVRGSDHCPVSVTLDFSDSKPGG